MIAGRFTAFMAFVVFSMALAMPAYAGTISASATLTADNFYALFHGTENGVTKVGRNETGSGGDPGTYNWSKPETFNFQMAPGDLIYVLAWDDGTVAQGLIGDFTIGGHKVSTNTDDWEVYTPNVNGNTNGDLSDGVTLVNGFITDAANSGWKTIVDVLGHGDQPWGKIPGISDNAQWIWGDALIGDSDPEYQLFRLNTAAVPVPEPAMFGMLAAGMLGLGIFRRRRTV